MIGKERCTCTDRLPVCSSVRGGGGVARESFGRERLVSPRPELRRLNSHVALSSPLSHYCLPQTQQHPPPPPPLARLSKAAQLTIQVQLLLYIYLSVVTWLSLSQHLLFSFVDGVNNLSSRFLGFFDSSAFAFLPFSIF